MKDYLGYCRRQMTDEQTEWVRQYLIARKYHHLELMEELLNYKRIPKEIVDES